MATKKPKQPAQQKATWGKTLSPAELIKLLDLLDAKKKEQDMSKLSDTLAKALAKKKGIHHVDGSDATPAKDTKKKVKTAPPAGKKPPTRSAGRGR